MDASRRFFLRQSLLLLLMVGPFVPSWASHEDIGSQAPAAAMGEAMTAGSTGISALDYNPAGLGAIQVPEFGLGYKRAFVMPAGNTDLSQLSGALGVPVDAAPLRGALGVSWEYTPRDTVALDRAVGLTYATRGFREFDSGMLDVGVTLKSLSRSGRQRGGSVSKAGVDIGGTFRTADNRVFGLSFMNLNGPRTDAGGVPDRAPVEFKVGYAQLLRGFTVALDATRREPSSGFAPSFSLGSGVEYWWHTARSGAVAARTGLNLGDPARFWGLGGGWKIYGAEMDYALQIPLGTGTRLGNTVSMIYRFGRWSPEEEYEKILGSELRYRRELSRSLDAAEIKQWKLSQELEQLREDMRALRTELAAKAAGEAQAQERLRSFEERERRARQALEDIRRQKEAVAAKSKESLYREDWAKYLELKSQGAPDAVLQQRVGQILREYKNSGVDLSEPNQELLRLQRSAPAP